MSKLDDLINKFCPDGVEYKTLGELGEFYGGLTGKGKNDFIDGNAKFITYMNVYKNLKLKLDVPEKVKINPGEKQRTLEYGDVLFTGSSETPDECGISSVLADKTDEKLYLNSFCICFRFNDPTIFNPEFSKYLFRSQELRVQIGKTASGVTRFNVSKEKMKKVIVPIVPLEIQNEIVHILDNFTELEEELEEELVARRKQYEYYRDSLLSFDDSVEWKTIGDITNVFSAKRVYRDQWQKQGVPFWRSSDLISFFNGVENTRGKAYISEELYESLAAISGKIQKDDILITGGGTIGIPYIVPTNDPLYVKDGDLLCIQHNDFLDSRFLYHYFLSGQFRKYLSEITHDATIAHYTIIQIRNTPVPIPNLEKQKMIATVLDRFEALCNDITSGLPAEIEARHKQYEYYRDKLLTFKRKSA